MNDTLVDGALTFGCAVVGLLCAVVGYVYGTHARLSRANLAVLGVSSAFIGAASAMVVTAMVDSAVSTVFVCFAEDPGWVEYAGRGGGCVCVYVYGVKCLCASVAGRAHYCKSLELSHSGLSEE